MCVCIRKSYRLRYTCVNNHRTRFTDPLIMIVCDVTRISSPLHYNLFASIPAHTNIRRCQTHTRKSLSTFTHIPTPTPTHSHKASLSRDRALRSRTIFITKYTNHNNNLANNSSDCSPQFNITAMSFPTTARSFAHTHTYNTFCRNANT